MDLADDYCLPLHELLDRWTSREISQLLVRRKMKQDALEAVLDKKPKQQEPDEILEAIDGL